MAISDLLEKCVISLNDNHVYIYIYPAAPIRPNMRLPTCCIIFLVWCICKLHAGWPDKWKNICTELTKATFASSKSRLLVGTYFCNGWWWYCSDTTELWYGFHRNLRLQRTAEDGFMRCWCPASNCKTAYQHRAWNQSDYSGLFNPSFYLWK